jgi:hypothetical protein
MAGGRPPGPRALPHLDKQALKMARLMGESDGHMMGRLDERTAITNWLKWQSGTPRELATRISMGEHTKGSPTDG